MEQGYLDLLKDVLENGRVCSDRTGVGTKSVFKRDLRFDMSKGEFPLVTTKRMGLKDVMKELLWFIDGDTNVSTLIKQNCNIWNEWAYEQYIEAGGTKSMAGFVEGVKGGLHYDECDLGKIYGKQWRDFGGVDQLKEAINTLKTNPDSRRIIVNSWNAGELSEMKLPPCHLMYQFKSYEMTHQERVEWAEDNGVYSFKDKVCFDSLGHSYEMEKHILDKHNVPKRWLSMSYEMRSVDTTLGLPYNIASYGLLLLMVAQQTDHAPLELCFGGKDCHIYLNHIEGAEEQITREPKKPPKVKLRKADDLFSYQLSDMELIGYEHHPRIKFPVAV